jgi:hypothetical protein
MRAFSKALTSAVSVAAAASLAFAVAAAADGSKGKSSRHDDEAERVLSTNLIPSLVAGPTVNGVKPGGKDWLLRRGSASIRSDGSIRVKVKGLVFAESGTTTTANGANTVAAVSASLFCDAALIPVGTTAAAPLSADGNATITGTLTLPARCNAPTVMVHPGTNAAAYIAISGFRM